MKKILAGWVCAFIIMSSMIVMIEWDGNVRADGYGNYPAPGFGDWHVTIDTYVGNETIFLTGNLWVESGATLTFNNVTLKMDVNFNGQFNISVNGTFNIYNSRITNIDGVNRYHMEYNSGSSGIVEKSNISYAGWSQTYSGFRLVSPDVYVFNSSFYNGFMGIRTSASATCINNTIINMDNYGMMIGIGTPIIENNRIYNSGNAGIYVTSPSITIRNCLIDGCYLGIFSALSDATFENCTLVGTSQESIVLTSGSDITLVNTTDDSEFYLFGHADTSLTKKWFLNTEVLDTSDTPIENAIVRIRDNANGTFDENFTTDATGWARWILVNESYETQAGKILYTPHNVTVSKGLLSNETVPEQVMDQSRNLLVKLESNLSPHAPFRINSNADFAAHANGGGDGSAGNPWIIENYDINGAGYGYCIYIGNTTDYFVVRGCNLYEASGVGSWPYYRDSGIILYNVQNGNIANNTANSNNQDGIFLYSSSSNTIANNTASNNWYGLLLSSSSSNTIANNTASNNEYGIYLSSSSTNTIANNTANSNNWYGLLLSSSSTNTIANNTMLGDGMFILGNQLQHWNTHSIDTTNTVNGKPVYYWKNQTGGTVPAGAGQVILANCTDVVVENQNVSDGTCGIELGFSSNNTIANNTASNNEYGIYLSSSSNNTIANNTASNNRYGIYLSSSSDSNTIANNTANSNNWYGLLLSSSSSNTIYHNNFIGNMNQAYDDTITNFWNASYPIGGNYWSDYAGTDTMSGPSQDQPGADGIGDLPYNSITGQGILGGADAQDDYPLMQPTNGFSTADTQPPASSVDSITPFWRNTSPLTITATASDTDSGVANVTLRYRFSANSTGWGAWTNFGIDTAAPWNWTFTFPDGQGYYEFYSIANDTANNTEAAPVTADASCAYDITAPEITDNSQAAGTTGDSYTFRAMATDNLNLSAVHVIYRFGSGTEINATMARTTADNYELGITIPLNNLDTLHYRIVAVDMAGNWNSTAVKDVIVSDNDDPVANAGPDQSVGGGTLVTLDGSGSTDNIGITNYTWAFTHNGTAIILYGVSPMFRLWTAGNYTVTLTVRDAAGNTGTDTMRVNVAAVAPPADTTPPAANAGPDQTVNAGALVTFTGAGSTDNIGITNYTWTLTYNSTAITLYGVSPTFRFWTAGNYTVTLTVRDSAGNTDTDTVLITVNPVSGPGDGGGLGNYLWIIIILIIVIVLAILVFMKMGKGKAPEEVETAPDIARPKEEESTGESQEQM